MLNVLIIEDEEPAAKRLKRMLNEVDMDITVLDTLDSVSEAKKWFQANPMPDLIFSDIHLSDGLSFEIFKEVKNLCPIIFITAYNQYAIEAFKVNGIDYLLKPKTKEDLERALNKFNNLRQSNSAPAIDIPKLLQNYNQAVQGTDHKKRFLVRYGEHMKTINIEDTVYFYTEDKVNFICTKDGRRFVIDYNLDALETLLDPKVFFRINRQYIIAIYSITEMFTYSKSRVLIKLNPPAKHETIVSTERSADFKSWLGGEK